MAKKSPKESLQEPDFVSQLAFDEVLQQVEFDLRIKEFVVMEIDRANYIIKPNMPYRSDYFCIFLVQEGSVGFRLDDKKYMVYKGDIVFCPMAETFWVDDIADDYNAKYIFFSVDFISQAGFNYKSNNVLKSLSSDPTHIVRNEPELYKRLQFYLDELKMLNNKEKDNYYFNEMIWHHFSLVIYEIDNYFKKIEKPHSVTPREDELTTSFFILVQQYFKDEHNVQFYADKLFISRKYLTKVINKTMFKTPRDIIHQVLAVEARLLLRNPNLNVNEVASKLKFSDQASFSKFFKKHTGRAPLEYRKDDLY
ncbi:AraC family transcriptional regulator [Chryseobacterium sp. G0162]|uniref:helix-turn-helix domain-containing protein n=1 Tax=unclassified Chryseobacterium TaxID=2593645 RepID=UPI000F514270|nr:MULTISPECIES: helix-turn-helix transcriptional regulator [unclassified Chryseobacterium]AZB10712.1 AraC family transcriptional regulator [Chryseobacterium sp. G0162]